MGVLKKTPWNIEARGPLVCVKIGNVSFDMEYSSALELAQSMRIIAKQAKANAGDKSFTFAAKGLLTDAESDEKRIQGLRDATAHFKVG